MSDYQSTIGDIRNMKCGKSGISDDKTCRVGSDHETRMEKWSSSMASDVKEQIELGEVSNEPGEIYDYLKTSYRANAPSSEAFEDAVKRAMNKLNNSGTSDGAKKGWETRKHGGGGNEPFSGDFYAEFRKSRDAKPKPEPNENLLKLMKWSNPGADEAELRKEASGWFGHKQKLMERSLQSQFDRTASLQKHVDEHPEEIGQLEKELKEVESKIDPDFGKTYDLPTRELQPEIDRQDELQRRAGQLVERINLIKRFTKKTSNIAMKTSKITNAKKDDEKEPKPEAQSMRLGSAIATDMANDASEVAEREKTPEAHTAAAKAHEKAADAHFARSATMAGDAVDRHEKEGRQHLAKSVKHHAKAKLIKKEMAKAEKEKAKEDDKKVKNASYSDAINVIRNGCACADEPNKKKDEKINNPSCDEVENCSDDEYANAVKAVRNIASDEDKDAACPKCGHNLCPSCKKVGDAIKCCECETTAEMDDWVLNSGTSEGVKKAWETRRGSFAGQTDMAKRVGGAVAKSFESKRELTSDEHFTLVKKFLADLDAGTSINPDHPSYKALKQFYTKTGQPAAKEVLDAIDAGSTVKPDGWKMVDRLRSMISNSGTSEGVRKAWETRKGSGYKWQQPEQRPAIGTTRSGKTIDHPNASIYSWAERRPKWNTTVNPLMDSREGGRILRQRTADWSKEDHDDAIAAHLKASKDAEDAWGKAAEEAAQATFGRPYDAIQDYKVSGVGRDEFSDAFKDRLRRAASDKWSHRSAAEAHWHASGRRQSSWKGLANMSHDEQIEFIRNAGTSEGAKKGWETRKGAGNVGEVRTTTVKPHGGGPEWRHQTVEFGKRGIDGRAVLHPEHQDAINKLNPGESTDFKDEQNERWTATRSPDGQTVNFQSHGLSGIHGDAHMPREGKLKNSAKKVENTGSFKTMRKQDLKVSNQSKQFKGCSHKKAFRAGSFK